MKKQSDQYNVNLPEKNLVNKSINQMFNMFFILSINPVKKFFQQKQIKEINKIKFLSMKVEEYINFTSILFKN